MSYARIALYSSHINNGTLVPSPAGEGQGEEI